MPKVSVYRGRTHLFDHWIEKPEVILGRSADADVPLDSPVASRKHCRIVKKQGSYIPEEIGAKNGLFYFGTGGRQAGWWGTSSSYQCVVPPVMRAGLLAGSGTPGACDGAFAQDLNVLWTSNSAKNPGAGATVRAQLWYRDPLNPVNSKKTSLSNGLEFDVRP